MSHRFCSARWGFDQGFDVFDESNVQDHAAITSPAITATALRFIEAHADRPFFLWLHYFDPHFAYREHPGFGLPRDDRYRGPIDSGMSFRALMKMRDSLQPEDIAELERLYDSEIAFTDHHIGVVLERLRELQLFERTLIVLTADHGEEFLDHGKLGHTKTLYDELVRVPLIIRAPGGAPGVVAEPVALLDVFPTVLEAAGVGVDHELEGRSLLDREPGADASRTVFTETDRPRTQRAALAGGMKLIEDVERRRFELYDLHDDPGEQRNLAERSGGDVERLAAELARLRSRLTADSPDAQRIDLSDEEVESLRALGYVQEPRR